ncbi:tRNA 2-selenouridine synthase [Campylobacter concisus]|uniref:tRNA 2-selenouridine synthase n=1 Tax=Campylobacter concisus TaxID=199 RepID=UPI000CD8812F|nr:tRNA 2-selenouridine synthase [Campylobacter concisus]QPH87378.1 tRNA 2-selenouridine synthase [Campylobacter concisus]QPI02325.1 tRNA 2-selenouridine synthase [Campylobacter concisus]
MKFTAFILLFLTSIFLIACSANQANKKISNSELENLAKQYGGVYIFNQKFVDEIERREKERSDYMDDFFKNNKRNFKRADLEIMDQKLPQTLSNGKRYYTRWIDYENQTGKKAKTSEVYINKIIEFIGLENFNKEKPYLDLGKLYVDDNGEIVPISIDVYYETYSTKYGLFGDEGMGISFSKKSIVPVSGGNKFILTNNKFIKANKDK